MVPLRLTLRNFMCYRDPGGPLDLSGMQVACLSGENGAGKSALLDAITWALWGRARARSDDELVHLGESEMEVELEFLVADVPYRVIRKRAKARAGRRTGQTILELQVLEEGDGPSTQLSAHGVRKADRTGGSYRPITGNTVRETQAALQRILHMDYDTFCNSAYIIQGRADEFTLKTPAERKAVLAEIIGLSYYDELEARARNKGREVDIAASSLDAEIRRMNEELSFKESYEEELAGFQSQGRALQGSRVVQEAQVAALRDRKALVDTKAAQLREAQRAKTEAEGEIALAESRRAEAAARIETYRTVLAQAEAIEAGAAQLEAARERSAALNQAAGQWAQLLQHKNRLESAIAEAGAKLQGEALGLRRQAEAFKESAAALDEKEAQLNQARVLLESLAQQEPALAQARSAAEATATAVQRLVADREALTREGQDLRKALDLFARNGAGAKCPLCDSELGEGGLQTLKQHYEMEIQERRRRYVDSEAELKRLRDEEARAKAEAERVEKRLADEHTKAQVRLATLGREVEQAKEASARLGEMLDALKALESRLVAGDYAHQQRPELREVAFRLAALQYDPEEHKALSQELQRLEEFAGKKQRLEEARRSLPREEADLASAEEAIARWRERRQTAAQTEAALSAELAGATGLSEELASAEAELERTRSELDRLRGSAARLEERLGYCRYLESLVLEKTEALQKARNEKSLYDELAQAFGVRGAQALIIELMLPQLEEEANQLLSRMTDNRMSLRFETQRARRTGGRDGLIETLDINIGDELGTRAYELYSGGEAFRINFALRVAMSKLLAQRSGAPLPTLIIDEGFGSQDNLGRQRLVEAINAIQPDFQRILVITHVEEMKDAFPVRIEVTKGPEGSTFEVV